MPKVVTPESIFNQTQHNKLYKKSGAQAQAFADFLPTILGAIRNQTVPNAEEELKARQLTDPTYNALEAARREASAKTDTSIAGGTGRDLVKAIDENAKITDPEYYKLRATLGDRLDSLLKPGLTPGESEAVTRSLAQQGQSRGTGFSPSATETVSNATQFGGAARSRLSQAVSEATAAIPQLRSGFDVANLSLGRPTVAQNNINNSGQGPSSQFLGNVGDLEGTIEKGKLETKDTLDKISQVAGAGKNLAGSL